MTLINMVDLVEYCRLGAGGDATFSIRWWNEFYVLSANMWMCHGDFIGH